MSNANPPSQNFQYFPHEKGTPAMETIMTPEQVSQRCDEIAKALANDPTDPRYLFIRTQEKLKLLKWHMPPRLNPDDGVTVETPTGIIEVNEWGFDIQLGGRLGPMDDALRLMIDVLEDAAREIKLAMFICEHS
jgi:hypothetical protein